MANAEGSNPFSVDGCRVVIVGGTAGIGFAVANYLVASGATMVVTGRRGGEHLATPTGMSSVAMDVGDGESVESGFAVIDEIIDGIDCLILNAGIDAETGLIDDDHDLAAFERVIDINTTGLARAMHHGIQRVPDGGSVIVTSSPAGSIAAPGMAAYSASKAALDMLVKSWAVDLGPRHIRVNAVLPGIVESEMDSESAPDTELIRRMTVNGAHRRAEEMGPVFQFLASRASVTLTGSLVGAHDGISIGYSQSVMGYLAADLDDR